METAVNIRDRVRKNTPEAVNINKDRALYDRINHYRDFSQGEITVRLEKLQKEWDIERTLEVNASALGITGILLGTFYRRRWFLLPAVVTAFLLQHGVQGWCPPVSFFRWLGIRTRQEIDEEIYAMKVLRGDFKNITNTSSASEIMWAFRK
jgi:hypothetical protein